MIYLIIILAILYLAIISYITFSYKENNKAIEEIENRLLQLEKRIEETRRDNSNRFNNIMEDIIRVEEEIKENAKRKCKCKKEV